MAEIFFLKIFNNNKEEDVGAWVSQSVFHSYSNPIECLAGCSGTTITTTTPTSHRGAGRVDFFPNGTTGRHSDGLAQNSQSQAQWHQTSYYFSVQFMPACIYPCGEPSLPALLALLCVQKLLQCIREGLGKTPLYRHLPSDCRTQKCSHFVQQRMRGNSR